MKYGNLFVSSEFPERLSNKETLVLFNRMKQGDMEAREELISGNIDLVIRCIRKNYMNTKYDKDKKYVYYENKKIGLNGINVTSMDITSISYDSNTKTYTSSVKINYSDRARELMKIDSSNGIIKYTRSNNNLYLESFEINK